MFQSEIQSAWFPESSRILNGFWLKFVHILSAKSGKGFLIQKNMKSILAILYIFLLPYSVLSQSGISGSLGIGMGCVKFSKGHLAFNLKSDICYRDSILIYSLSYTMNDEFTIFIDPSEKLSQLDAKIGGCYDYKRDGFIFPFVFIYLHDISYSVKYKTGFTFISYEKRIGIIESGFMSDKYKTKKYAGFGIPIELELRQELFSFFGLYSSVFFNFNTVKSYYGFNSGIYFGIL